MTKIINSFFLYLMLFSASAVLADYSFEDVKKIQNDKEVKINSFSKKEQEKISKKYSEEKFNSELANIFHVTLHEFLNEERNQCELNLIQRYHEALENSQIPHTSPFIEDYFKVLRINHVIDDLLYEILVSINADYLALQQLDLTKKTKFIFFNNKKLLKFNDIKELFSNFETWPDETNNCAYQEFIYLKKHIKYSPTEYSAKSSDLEKVILAAFEENIIDLATYNKLEYLRIKSGVNNRILWLKDYLKIIFNAKNRLSPFTKTYETKDLEKEDDFFSLRIKRLSYLTRRQLLYKKYDETQILMLAQVLQKASRRMGVDPDTDSSIPVIIQEFNILQPNGERKNYVERIELDPQSQYNLARRLLRKDILELQMMDTFNKITISYLDVVMAAYETGYITQEDLEFVVKYDDLWNPEISKWEKISNFIFKVAGYSSFFVPSPWNVVTTIAIGVVEGVVDNKFFRNGAENDNPATFIE